MPALYQTAPELSYDIDALFGYQYFFNKGFDINLYYGYHHYSGDSAFMGINYQHTLNLSVGYNYFGLYSYANAYSFHGKSNNYFIDMGLGYYKEFNFKRSYLSIFPIVSLTSGTDKWFFDDITNSNLSFYQDLLAQEGYKLNAFDLQCIDLMLSAGLSFTNFSVYLTYLYSLPTGKYKTLGWEKQSGVMLSLNYLLNLKK